LNVQLFCRRDDERRCRLLRRASPEVADFVAKGVDGFREE